MRPRRRAAWWTRDGLTNSSTFSRSLTLATCLAPQQSPNANRNNAVVYYLFLASQKAVAEKIIGDIFARGRDVSAKKPRLGRLNTNIQTSAPMSARILNPDEGLLRLFVWYELPRGSDELVKGGPVLIGKVLDTQTGGRVGLAAS